MPARPDPRISAIVRLLARKAAEKDFARAAELHGRTRNHQSKEEL